MKSTFSTRAIVGLLMLVTSSTAMAYTQHNTGKRTSEPSNLTPEDPGQPGDWIWRSPESTPAGPWSPGLPATPLTLYQNEFIYLGMDNDFQLNETKTLRLAFSWIYDDGHTVFPTVSGSWGSSGGTGKTNQPSTTTEAGAPESLGGGLWSMECVWTWTIKPQPDWEYVKVGNFSSDTQSRITMSNISFTSECTPEPSALALFMFGIGTLWRRKR